MVLRHGGDQLVLGALHQSARGGLQVIVSQQMQDTMNGITNDFLRPLRFKFPGLGDGVGHGDINLAVQRPGSGRDRRGRWLVRMIERDDVRGTFVLKITLIDPGHLAGADEVQAQFPGRNQEMFSEDEDDDLTQEAGIDGPSSLAVLDDQEANRPARDNRCGGRRSVQYGAGGRMRSRGTLGGGSALSSLLRRVHFTDRCSS